MSDIIMPGSATKQRSKFTIYHGIAISLALHASLGLPFVLHRVTEPEDPSTLVFEMNGAESDTQTEQANLQQTKGAEKDVEGAQAQSVETPKVTPPDPTPPEKVAEKPPEPRPQPPPPDDTPKDEVIQEEAKPVPQKPVEASQAPATAGAAENVAGLQNEQKAQTLKSRQAIEDFYKQYGQMLSKRIYGHLVYPDKARRAGLHGVATVAFTILSNGQIRPESLKIVASSGQPVLDDSALKTIQAAVPFDAPPNELPIKIAVDFGKKL